MRRCALFALFPACVGPLEAAGESAARVDAPAVLAIVAEPAEAAPGAMVTYRAVLAGPDGPLDQAPVRWSFCRTPRDLGDNTAVSATCAEEPELALPGRDIMLSARIPVDACARFGPENSAGIRPSDPDASGGYYQPVRAALDDGAVMVLRHRVRCAIAQAPIEVARAYAERYRANLAPRIEALSADEADGATAAVQLSLRVATDAHESYLRYDPARGALVGARERLDVTWFTTGGSLARVREQLEGLATANRWFPPAEPAPMWVWAIVRDERGGIAAAALALDVS